MAGVRRPRAARLADPARGGFEGRIETHERLTADSPEDGCFDIPLPRVPECFPRPKTPEGCFDPFPRDRREPGKRTARRDGSAGRKRKEDRRADRKSR